MACVLLATKWLKMIKNAERPGFRNFKITNIKIINDELFFYLRIYFFIF